MQVMTREVAVAGVGLHHFGRFPETETSELVQIAVRRALDDAHLGFDEIDLAYYSHVYYQGASPGEVFLKDFGLTGLPVINVENACASGTTAIWQAYWMIATGVVDTVLVAGSERVPRGPVASTAEDDPHRLLGGDHMMATYALRADEYMRRYGAPVDALAEVAVKSSFNRSRNEYSQYDQTYTRDEVLGSRMIAEPLTLFQCCPTSEGAAAAVLTAARPGGDDRVRVRGAALATDRYEPRSVQTMEGITSASRTVYDASGVGPQDVDLVQVHDASTIGELLRVEALGLVGPGEAWRATLDGRTRTAGDLPVNTDGGLLGMGHPFGATGIRQLHESTRQLQGVAGERQVSGAEHALIQCSGAGGVSTVVLLGI